ncbi:MAG TPA: EAL domain-containing protein [Thermoanaerobaculia bacterium]|nr:EAL domain-containing protein [Thermoanaerobaculia bacterium]
MKSARTIKKAVEGEDFELHYQPIVDRRTGRAVAAEALLRWRKPGKHSGKAGEVAAAAEEGSAIFQLDDWSMSRACSDANSWSTSGVTDLRLNLNLSAKEFFESGIIKRLRASMDASGFDPSMLNLELTETSAIEDPETAMKLFKRLKKLGVQIWLDDFGTGHSSLAWLRHFPVDGLKIPGTFVENLATDHKDQTIVTAISTMARSLGLKVIAEGVENQDQLAFLDQLECDMIQGYLFYEALPIDTLCQQLSASGDVKKKRVRRSR